MCKGMKYVDENHKCLTVGKNWIIGITEWYNEPFDTVQMNELRWIEYPVLYSKTCSQFTV